MQSIDIIRLSEKQKQQLIILKRKTGIENWNVLCRWALCMSLADPTVPPKEDIPSDSNIEMTWRTLCGEYDQTYKAIILFYKNNSKQNMSLIELIKIHISRGLNLISRNLDENLPKSDRPI
jgi:DNA sulfur modification protein DndE